MNWNMIKFNPAMRYDIQDTLPKVGMPVVYIKPGKDPELNDYKIGRLLLDKMERPKLGIWFDECIDGIWWSYLDPIAEKIDAPDDIIISCHQVYKFSLDQKAYPDHNFFEGQNLKEKRDRNSLQDL